jgi:hypothetical protein
MDISELVGKITLYGLAWTFVSCGAAVILAMAFFGIEEKNLEEDEDDL